MYSMLCCVCMFFWPLSYIAILEDVVACGLIHKICLIVMWRYYYHCNLHHIHFVRSDLVVLHGHAVMDKRKNVLDNTYGKTLNLHLIQLLTALHPYFHQHVKVGFHCSQS